LSKQREIMPRVLQRFTAVDPACVFLVLGSVQFGHERPDSDVDLMAIVHDSLAPRFDLSAWRIGWEARGVKNVEQTIEGTPVQVFFAPTAAFERWLNETPYFMFPFSRAEVLHDPECLAERYQGVARRYFAEHPVLAEAWTAQLEAHKQVKLLGRDKDGFYRTPAGEQRKYLTLGEFSAHIELLAKEL
jgi:hypothetical protein